MKNAEKKVSQKTTQPNCGNRDDSGTSRGNDRIIELGSEILSQSCAGSFPDLLRF